MLKHAPLKSKAASGLWRPRLAAGHKEFACCEHVWICSPAACRAPAPPLVLRNMTHACVAVMRNTITLLSVFYFSVSSFVLFTDLDSMMWTRAGQCHTGFWNLTGETRSTAEGLVFFCLGGRIEGKEDWGGQRKKWLGITAFNQSKVSTIHI